MKYCQEIEEQKSWIRSGKIGCTFASYLVRKHDEIGWHFTMWNGEVKMHLWGNTLIASIIFPGFNKDSVRRWALANGMYIEKTGEDTEGLRYKNEHGVSWVQYFGPDSHVKTRQSPHPMLTFTIKRPAHTYAKVGWNGILHLAHASIEGMGSYLCNRLWDTSLDNTTRVLGHKAGPNEAAKVTFKW